MKIFIIDNNQIKGAQEVDNWYLAADSALSNHGKPFFMPEGMGKITVSASMAFRISRLGKSIKPRFAERYYEEIAPILHFRLADLKRRLSHAGLPFSEAVSFDKSVMYGPFIAFNNMGKSHEWKFRVNGKEAGLINPILLKEKTAEIIANVSRMNTLKMGDLILPELKFETEITIGDILELGPDLKVKIK